MDSLKIFLGSECMRYNKLLSVISSSMQNIKKAIIGEITMSEDLEKMYHSFYNN
jgi:dynein heavy chain